MMSESLCLCGFTGIYTLRERLDLLHIKRGEQEKKCILMCETCFSSFIKNECHKWAIQPFPFFVLRHQIIPAELFSRNMSKQEATAKVVAV